MKVILAIAELNSINARMIERRIAAAGAGIDLLLSPPRGRQQAIEVKCSLKPKLEKGFYIACEDLDPVRRIVVYPGTEIFPLKMTSKQCPSPR